MHFDLQYKHTFVLLYFALLCFPNNCVFYKLMVCGNPSSSKTIGAIFPTAFAHFVSLCHILIILAIFPTSLLLCLWWWSAISDLCCNLDGLVVEKRKIILSNSKCISSHILIGASLLFCQIFFFFKLGNLHDSYQPTSHIPKARTVVR